MINVTNTEKLRAALLKAQERATVRCISSDEFAEAVEHIEAKLSGMLFKKDWTGLQFRVNPCAQSFPSAYSYTPESTHFTVVRRPSGWFVSDIERAPCGEAMISPRGLAEKADALVAFSQQSKVWRM